MELIVIDSVAALINNVGGRGKSVEDENIVVENMQSLRKTAESCGFPILCTNQGRILTTYTGTHFLTPTSTHVSESTSSSSSSSSISSLIPRLMFPSAFVNSFQINQNINTDSSSVPSSSSSSSSSTSSSSSYDIHEGSSYSIPVTSSAWQYCVDTQLVLATGEFNINESIDSVSHQGLVSPVSSTANNTLENMLRTNSLFSLGRIRIQNSKQCSISQSEQVDSYFYLCDNGLYELL